MENSFNKNDDNNNANYKLNTLNENDKAKSPNLNVKKSSPKKLYKESSFMPKKFSLIDEIKQSTEERMAKSDNMRRASMPNDPRRGEIEKFDLKINYKKEGKIKKKNGVNRQFLRKNAKKNIPPKYKREANFVNKIKVVGTVSAKLNALIQRLEQNNASTENSSSNQYGNKVVMAPRIKAALEKFNKKKEEKPEIIHYDDEEKYRRKNKTNQEEKYIKVNLSIGDIYNNEKYEEEYEEEEEEEEEDEDYEKGGEEEKDEGEEKEDDIQNQKRIHRRNVKIRTIKKRRTGDNDNGKKINEIDDNVKDNMKKKNRKMRNDNNFKDEEDEYDDEYSNEYDEQRKKKRIKRRKKKDNSKDNSSQESGECKDEKEYEEGSSVGKSSNSENSFYVNKKYRKKKKKRNFEFSEDKSENNERSDKKKKLKDNNKIRDSNKGRGIIRLKKELVCHKSGHGDTIIKSTSKGDIFFNPEVKESNKKDNNSINKINNRNDSFPSQNPINMVRNRTNLVKKENVNNEGISKTIENKRNKSDNLGGGTILTIKKRFVKNIEFENFLHKNYIISDFKSKSNGKKNIKEILKYIPSKQADFTLYAIYENKNDNDYDKKIVKGKVVSSNLKKNNNIYDNMNKKKNKLNNINEKDDISNNYKFKSSLNNYNKNNDVNEKESPSTNIKNIISSKNYKNIEVIDNQKWNKKTATSKTYINDNRENNSKYYQNNIKIDSADIYNRFSFKKISDDEEFYEDSKKLKKNNFIHNYKNKKYDNRENNNVDKISDSLSYLKNYNNKEINNDENKDYKNNGMPLVDRSYNDDISSKIKSYKIVSFNHNIDENPISFINNKSIKEYKNNQINNEQKYINTIKKFGNKETENEVQNRNIVEDISVTIPKKYKNTINNYNNMNSDILDDNSKIFKNIVLNIKYKNSPYNDNELIEKNSNNTKNKISSKKYNSNVHNTDNDKNSTNFVNSPKGKYYNNNDNYEEDIKNNKNEISVIKGNNNEDLNDDQIIFKNIGEMKKYNKISGDIKENSVNCKNSVSIKKNMKKGDINGDKENNSKNCKVFSMDKYYSNNDDNDNNSKKNKYDISMKKYNKNNNVLDDTSNNIKNNTCTKKYNNNIVQIESKKKVSMEKKNNDLDYDLKNFKNSVSMIKNKNNKIESYFNDNSNTFKINMKKYNKSEIDENPISIKNSIQTIKNSSINEMNENSQYYKNLNSEKKYINNNDYDELKKKIIINNQSIKVYKNNNDMDEKSHLNSISSNNYNISHFEKILNEIEKNKAEIINENINFNNEFKKGQKKYQSIILSYDKDFLELSNILNEKNKNNGVFKKNRNVKRKKLSVFQIVKRRGIVGNVEDNQNLENMNTDSEKTKKVKFNNLSIKKQIQNDEENIKINKNKEGEKYILFKFKADLKKIYKKKKWILEPSETNFFTLKSKEKSKDGNRDSIRKKYKVYFNNDEEKDKKDKDINDINAKYRYKTQEEKKYNIKGDKRKIEKTYISDDAKKYVNNCKNDESEVSNSSSSSIKEKQSKKNIIKNKKFDFQISQNKQLYYDLLLNENEKYEKEKKNSHKDIFKGILNDSENNDDNQKKKQGKYKRKEKRVFTVEVRKKIEKEENPLNNFDNEDNMDKDFRRKEKRVHTIEGRTVGFHVFTFLEDNFKGINRLKCKKAKIIKFKSHKGDLDPYYTRRKKENVFERLSSKKEQTVYCDGGHKKLMHYSFTRKERSNENLKNYQKKNRYENISFRSSDNEELYNKKDSDNFETISITKVYYKIKRLKTISPTDSIQNYNNKSHNKQLKTLNTKSFENKKINLIINNNKNNKINRRYQFKVNKKNNSISKNLPYYINAKINNISIPHNKSKLKEVSGINEIKSNFKKKLIEMNDKLLDAIHYYNGPIDISCIVSKNYAESVNELSKKVLKNGFKFVKYENNYFKFSNGINSLLVEIVKIRNNILYYLVFKNQ